MTVRVKPRRIYLGGGVYGCGNIGDDAILQSILQIMEKAVPDAQITVATAHVRRLEFLPSDLRIVDSYDLKGIAQAIRACDCFVSGGGTLIGDELGLSFPLAHNARRIATAKYYGKGVVMLAIGANKLRSPEGTQVARMLVRLSDLVTLRDRQSFEVCADLGARSERLFVTADPAFLAKAKETPRTRELKARIRTSGKALGVNVVNEAWVDLREYKSAIAQACDVLSSRCGYFPFFFSNEIRPGKKYDYQANLETASMLHCDHEVLEPVYYNPEEMIDIISSFDCIIAMRMHALIFAALTGTPFVAVSRVDKVENFMHLFGLAASGSVDQCRPEKLIADTEHILARWPTLKPQVENKVVELKSACWKNVDLLRNVLNDRRTFRRKVSRTSLRYLLFLERENRLKRNLIHLLSGQLTISQAIRKLLRQVGFGQSQV
jgi:polysaccharide pyruvyl transferase WcaK-like protein